MPVRAYIVKALENLWGLGTWVAHAFPQRVFGISIGYNFVFLTHFLSRWRNNTNSNAMVQMTHRWRNKKYVVCVLASTVCFNNVFDHVRDTLAPFYITITNHLKEIQFTTIQFFSKTVTLWPDRPPDIVGRLNFYFQIKVFIIISKAIILSGSPSLSLGVTTCITYIINLYLSTSEWLCHYRQGCSLHFEVGQTKLGRGGMRAG